MNNILKDIANTNLEPLETLPGCQGEYTYTTKQEYKEIPPITDCPRCLKGTPIKWSPAPRHHIKIKWYVRFHEPNRKYPNG